MPEGWSTNRGLAQSIVEKGVSLGMSLSAIQDTLQEAGMGYRRTDIAADIRRVTGRRLNEEPISRLQWSSFVPVHMVEELPWNMNTNYWYRFKAVYTDQVTGEQVTRDFNLGADEWLPKAGAEGRLRLSIPLAECGEGRELTDLQLTGVSHKSGSAYNR